MHPSYTDSWGEQCPFSHGQPQTLSCLFTPVASAQFECYRITIVIVSPPLGLLGMCMNTVSTVTSLSSLYEHSLEVLGKSSSHSVCMDTGVGTTQCPSFHMHRPSFNCVAHLSLLLSCGDDLPSNWPSTFSTATIMPCRLDSSRASESDGYRTKRPQHKDNQGGLTVLGLFTPAGHQLAYLQGSTDG